MNYLIVLVVVAVAVSLISAPFRAAREPASEDWLSADSPAPAIAEIEAARDAKYREIRDAELDLRTGKLSQGDYEAIAKTLRAEAVEILRALDQAQEA